MKNRSFIVLFIILQLILTGCGVGRHTDDTDPDTDNKGITEACGKESSPQDEQSVVLEGSEHYTVSESSHGLYRYRIEFIDGEGKCAAEKYTRNQPAMMETEYNGDGIVGFMEQAGTGVSTRYAVFFNPTDGSFSETFTYFLDVFDNKVLLGKPNGVVIRDIFDVDTYYKEITSFEDEIGQNLADAVSAEFLDNGETVTVTYRINERESKTAVFDLNSQQR